jgi:hypothetical protein
LPQFAVLAFQRFQLIRDIRRDARPLAAIDLRFFHPLVEGVGGATDLLGDRNHGCPARGVFALMLGNHTHRPLADLRGKLVRSFAHRGSILSGDGASGKPGAVHTRALPFAQEDVSLQSQLVALVLQREFERAEKSVRLAFEQTRRQIIRQYLPRTPWFEAGKPTLTAVELPTMAFMSCVREPSLSQLYNTTWLDNVTDVGVALIIHKTDDLTLRNALVRAANRWNVIELTGSDEYIASCIRLAADLRITVAVGSKIYSPPRPEALSTDMAALIEQEAPALPVPVEPLSQTNLRDATSLTQEQTLDDVFEQFFQRTTLRERD